MVFAMGLFSLGAYIVLGSFGGFVSQEKVDELTRLPAQREGVLVNAVIGELTEGERGSIKVLP